MDGVGRTRKILPDKAFVNVHLYPVSPRVAVGMAILMGIPIGMELKFRSHGNPEGCRGNGNSHRNGMGIEIPFPRQPCYPSYLKMVSLKL